MTAELSPPRLRVGVVGAGRVGAVLGAAWRKAGHHITGVSAVSDLSRLRAEALLPGVEIRDVPSVCANSELVLLAVPDDVLPELVTGLARSGVFRDGTFLVHTSGRYGIEVLAPADNCLAMAIHPVMTFTGTSIDLDRLAGAPWGVTAAPEVATVAEALVLEVGGEPVWVPELARITYHAALALSANYLNTLVTQASEILRDAGVEDSQRLLTPLLHASLDNALRHGDQALTGPIARGDSASVAAHLDVLNDPAVANAYRALGRLAADRALGAGVITMDQAGALLEVLADESR
ncbi:MAG: hypothetical protein RJB01_305 [Actinomycetota bacterium]